MEQAAAGPVGGGNNTPLSHPREGGQTSRLQALGHRPSWSHDLCGDHGQRQDGGPFIQKDTRRVASPVDRWPARSQPGVP